MFCKQEGGKARSGEGGDGRGGEEEGDHPLHHRRAGAMHGWPQLPLPTRPPTDIRRGGGGMRLAARSACRGRTIGFYGRMMTH